MLIGKRSMSSLTEPTLDAGSTKLSIILRLVIYIILYITFIYIYIIYYFFVYQVPIRYLV